MTTLSVFDPAQCCATGACSPDASDEQAMFASALEWLKENGVAVTRYNLGHQPGEFVRNAVVKQALNAEGVACLPMLIADGNVIGKGRYLSREELGGKLGLGVEAPALATASACCAGPAAKRCCG